MQYCRDLTRKRARNFYYGLKLLPEPRRSAMYAIYAWMRRADDLADGGIAELDAASERIEALRGATDRAFAGDPGDDPVLIGVADTASRFPIQAEHFHDMLDGQLDDLAGQTYTTFDELHEYCRRVASSVGLVCIEVWGYDGDDTPLMARDLGVAFQLTNILRDYVEDYDAGRVYLPDEEFAKHGTTPDDLRHWRQPDRCVAMLRMQIERAESFYRRADRLDERIEPGSLPTLWAMRAIYHRLLEKIRRDPAQLIRGPRVGLTKMEKGTIALRARLRPWLSRSAQR
jgi:phytoene synthase